MDLLRKPLRKNYRIKGSIGQVRKRNLAPRQPYCTLTHIGTFMCSDRRRVILFFTPSQKETVISLSPVLTHNHRYLMPPPSCGNHDHFPRVLKKPCTRNRCVHLMCVCFCVLSDHILEPWQRKRTTQTNTAEQGPHLTCWRRQKRPGSPLPAGRHSLG